MIIFYLTFLISCQNQPDYPIFARSTSLEEMSQVYAALREGELNGFTRNFKDGKNCTYKNVRLQYEEIRHAKNSKR